MPSLALHCPHTRIPVTSNNSPTQPYLYKQEEDAVIFGSIRTNDQFQGDMRGFWRGGK